MWATHLYRVRMGGFAFRTAAQHVEHEHKKSSIGRKKDSAMWLADMAGTTRQGKKKKGRSSGLHWKKKKRAKRLR